MKAEKSKPKFEPITLIIESECELAVLWVAIGSCAVTNVQALTKGDNNYFPSSIKEIEFSKDEINTTISNFSSELRRVS